MTTRLLHTLVILAALVSQANRLSISVVKNWKKNLLLIFQVLSVHQKPGNKNSCYFDSASPEALIPIFDITM